MGAFADVALTLHRSGLNVVPAAGKRAIAPWKHLQAQRQTEAGLRHLMRCYPDADPAIVLGPASGGVVDLDLDDSTVAEKEIRQRRLPLPPTACFASLRGPHRLYRYDAPLPTRRKILSGVDFGGQGAIVVVPPAAGRHWLLPLEHLAPLPEAWADLARHSAHRPLPLHPTPPVPCSKHLNIQMLASPGALEDLFRDWSVVEQVCPVLQISGAARGRGCSFRCVLPGHSEQHPSAALWTDDSGRAVYGDFHLRSGAAWFPLPTVYAAQVSGQVRTTLDGHELAVWTVRLLAAGGVIVLPQVPLLTRLLPPDAPATVRKAAEGFDLLRRCRAPHDGTAPAPFSWRFAAAWCGISERLAGAAIRQLIHTGLLRPAGTHRGLTLFTVGRAGLLA